MICLFSYQILTTIFLFATNNVSHFLLHQQSLFQKTYVLILQNYLLLSYESNDRVRKLFADQTSYKFRLKQQVNTEKNIFTLCTNLSVTDNLKLQVPSKH